MSRTVSHSPPRRVVSVIAEVAYRLGGTVPIRTTPTLLYHRVERTPRPYDPWSVSVADFTAQMEELARLGCAVVDCDAPVPAGGQAVRLAFDDGYVSALEHALPVLLHHGYRATFFLVPGAMGGQSDWETPLGYPPSPVISWSDAGTLRDAGMTFGSHTCDHVDCRTLDDRELDRQIGASRSRIESELGVIVRGLSVPFGRDDPRIDPVLRRYGYTYKVTNEEMPRSDDGGLRVRGCTAILNGDSLHEFRRKLAGAYRWLHAYRRFRRRMVR